MADRDLRLPCRTFHRSTLPPTEAMQPPTPVPAPAMHSHPRVPNGAWGEAPLLSISSKRLQLFLIHVFSPTQEEF